MTKATLRSLFDFQRFEQNARLQKLIDATHSRVAARELTDDELDRVAAAGVPDAPASKKPGEPPK